MSKRVPDKIISNLVVFQEFFYSKTNQDRIALVYKDREEDYLPNDKDYWKAMDGSTFSNRGLVKRKFVNSDCC